VFNFLPVKFTDVPIDAGTLPYESSEQLDELRVRLAKTHTVVRLRGRVVCVPFAADSEVVGEPAKFGTSGPDLALAAYLLQAKLTRVLTEGWKFSLRKVDPLTFVSRLPGRDLMEQALKGRHAVDGLHVYPEYLLDVRRSGPMGHSGIIVGLKTRYEIALPVSELVQLGVQVVGQYVLTAPDTVPERLFQDPVARRRLAGVIEAVAGDRLGLGTPDGRVEVAASQAWLELRRDNFLAVVETVAGTSAKMITDALEYQMFKLIGAEGRYGAHAGDRRRPDQTRPAHDCQRRPSRDRQSRGDCRSTRPKGALAAVRADLCFRLRRRQDAPVRRSRAERVWAVRLRGVHTKIPTHCRGRTQTVPRRRRGLHEQLP